MILDMQIYRIEHGKKVPPISRPAPTNTMSRAAATMNELKKGDSFLVKDPIDAIRAAKVMRDLQRRERERSGTRLFTSRKIADGVRIWRTR
jgi:hypothetical protein